MINLEIDASVDSESNLFYDQFKLPVDLTALASFLYVCLCPDAL